MRSVPDVLAELAAICPAVEPRKLLLERAVDGVLDEALTLPAAIPDRARALRAGYAVSSRDLVGVSSYAPLIVADPPLLVQPGDPLPPGSDAVLPLDGLSRTGLLVEIVAAVGPGENAVRAGEDGRLGEIIAPAGGALHANAALAAAAAGLLEARVRKPRLRILSARASGVPGSLLARAGFDVTEGALDPIGKWGEADLTVVLTDRPLELAALGVRPIAAGLALRPGDATGVFLRGSHPVLVVPERLDALLAVTCALLKPLAAHLTGRKPEPCWRRAPLTRKLASSIGLMEIALLREANGGLEPLGLGSLSLPAIGLAEGWIAIPPESEGVQEGDVVEAYRF
jgi:molybdopterin biosynthesis enzyme